MQVGRPGRARQALGAAAVGGAQLEPPGSLEAVAKAASPVRGRRTPGAKPSASPAAFWGLPGVGGRSEPIVTTGRRSGRPPPSDNGYAPALHSFTASTRPEFKSNRA